MEDPLQAPEKSVRGGSLNSGGWRDEGGDIKFDGGEARERQTSVD